MSTSKFGDWVNLSQQRYSKKYKASVMDTQFTQAMQWTNFVSDLRSSKGGLLSKIQAAMEFDEDLRTVETWHPLAMAVKADSASAADNPSWEEAMNGPNADGYWKAAEIEIDTLRKMDTWDEVDREDWMNVLPSTWAFKCKRYPDGSIRKFKGRFRNISMKPSKSSRPMVWSLKKKTTWLGSWGCIWNVAMERSR